MEKIICDFYTYEKEIIAIRDEVFVNEQSVPKELEIDGMDPDCKHALIKIDNLSVATGRIQRDGHIGRVAVMKNFRGRGIGKVVIKLLIEWAKENSLDKVYLGAQLHAVDFYKALGFKKYGNIFLDAGIEHINMEMLIG